LWIHSLVAEEAFLPVIALRRRFVELEVLSRARDTAPCNVVTAPPLLILIAVKADDPDGHASLWFMADGAGDLVHGFGSVWK
jgi:hypothetical protein